MNKTDHHFCLVWAKKIRAINLLGGRCRSCGNTNIFILRFHHKEDKLYDIHNINDHRWSKIKREIIKCELLCGNCHNEIHENDRNPENTLIRNKLLKIKGIERCESCGHDKINNLSFHHIKDKKFGVGGYFGNFPIKTLLREMDKCIVLCHNCHTMQHININKFNLFKQIILEKVNNHIECKKPANVEEILLLHNQGMNGAEIGRRLGYAKSTICGILNK